jgi:hypothetical protein
MELNDYLNLIPASNVKKPKFVATITADVSVQIRVQQLLKSMLALFDLDAPPVGDQLDIIGQWVGVSRIIKTPISNVYFTWDSATLGWDYGTWQPSGDPGQVTALPDDAYLILIKSKIAANMWDGTTEGAYKVWDGLLSGTGITILIEDFQNMTYAMGVVGDIIPPLTLALITGGYINLRPEGIKITDYFVGSAPFFAWDTEADILKGWDEGKWATEVAPT